MIIRAIWMKLIKDIRGSAVRNSKIGKWSRMHSGCNLNAVVVGKHVGIGYDCQIFNTTIGNYCSIADNVTLNPGEHPLDWVSTSSVFYYHKRGLPSKLASLEFESGYAPVRVENDVWIGANSIIKGGLVIGNGAVIGMGSVVTKDVEPYTIVAGNPAKIIRKRFDEQTITMLLKSRWWDYEDDEIKKLSAYMNSPEEFLAHFYGKTSN